MSNITDQQENEKRPMPLRKGNFVAMAAAGVLIVLGFVLMLGAGSTVDAFNPDIFPPHRCGPMPGFYRLCSHGRRYHNPLQEIITHK